MHLIIYLTTFCLDKRISAQNKLKKSLEKESLSKLSVNINMHHVILCDIVILRRFSERVTPQSGDGLLKSDSSGETGW